MRKDCQFPHAVLVVFYLCFISLVPQTALAQSPAKFMIILDGSGSMWGQIDGKPKITIARETLDRVVEQLPPDAEVGLMVYGHRKKGDCQDIEMMVDPAPGQAQRIQEAVARLNPKGKTPLTSSVLMAAEQMKHTEDKATVILITDGLETCDAEPCQVAAELEQSGVDFTAHVIGFGLTEDEDREISCLAEATGGLYLAADNADELQEALDVAVAMPPPSEEEEVPDQPLASLTADDAVEQAARFTVVWEGPGDRHDAVQIARVDEQRGTEKIIRSRQVQQDDFEGKAVTLTAPADLGLYELRYYGSKSRKILATRAVEVTEAQVSLNAPESVEIAKNVKVEWQGPGGRYDAVEFFSVEAMAGEGKVIRRKALRNDDFDKQTVRLTAPALPGMYQLRYWNGENRKVLATREIEVVAAEVSLSAPEKVTAGKTIVVEWQGPGGKYDDVILFDPEANDGEGRKLRSKRLRNDDFDNRTARLTAPVDPGVYELRYWNGENKQVLATTSIEVEAGEVWVKGPESVEAGKQIVAQWEGPGGRYDAIILFDPDGKSGEGQKVREKRLRNDNFDNRTANLTAPAKPGNYELRYWNGENKKVLAVTPIEVVPVNVSLRFPAEIRQASTLVVEWEGPGGRYDDVQIYDPNGNNGEGKVIRGKRLRNDDFNNQKARLPAPSRVGSYLVRYWSGENKTVMATQPLEVIEFEVTLEVIGESVAGQKVTVSWTGPGARYDSVELVNSSGKKVAGKRVRNDDFENNRVTFKLPDSPGAYELRYWNGDNKVAMETTQIEVKPAAE